MSESSFMMSSKECSKTSAFLFEMSKFLSEVSEISSTMKGQSEVSELSLKLSSLLAVSMLFQNSTELP